MGDVHQQRLELLATPDIAADGERSERVAVIALAPRDEMAALMLANLQIILPSELERGFDRLRATRNEIDLFDAVRRMLDQMVGQRLRGLGREETRMGIGQLIELSFDRFDHTGVIVSEAGDGGAA